MRAFTQHQGIVAPLDLANVDTDMIIPKQFLKSIKRTGFGKNLFDELRYEDEGQPDQECTGRPLREDFVLNQAKYAGSSVLLARRNFGCGSAREHAPWALDDYGFRVVIAPSFADIFYNNCFKNGLLPIILSNEIVDKLFNYSGKISIDLINQAVETNDESYSFEVDPERKRRLINCLDDIGLTLQHEDQIRAFEKEHFAKFTWL